MCVFDSEEGSVVGVVVVKVCRWWRWRCRKGCVMGTPVVRGRDGSSEGVGVVEV